MEHSAPQPQEHLLQPLRPAAHAFSRHPSDAPSPESPLVVARVGKGSFTRLSSASRRQNRSLHFSVGSQATSFWGFLPPPPDNAPLNLWPGVSVPWGPLSPDVTLSPGNLTRAQLPLSLLSGDGPRSRLHTRLSTSHGTSPPHVLRRQIQSIMN